MYFYSMIDYDMTCVADRIPSHYRTLFTVYTLTILSSQN